MLRSCRGNVEPLTEVVQPGRAESTVRRYRASQNLRQGSGELLPVPYHHQVEIPESAGDDEVPWGTSDQIDTEAQSQGHLLDGFQETTIYPPSPIFEELGLADTQGN